MLNISPGASASVSFRRVLVGDHLANEKYYPETVNIFDGNGSVKISVGTDLVKV